MKEARPGSEHQGEPTGDGWLGKGELEKTPGPTGNRPRKAHLCLPGLSSIRHVRMFLSNAPPLLPVLHHEVIPGMLSTPLPPPLFPYPSSVRPQQPT